jgi:hypothetical protein
MFDVEDCVPKPVTLIRFRGTLEEADFAALDALARHRKADPPRDIIFDMTSVDELQLATDFVSKRGELPQAYDGRERIYVVPQDDLKLLVRLYAAYQASKGWRPPIIVNALEDAFSALGLSSSDFGDARPPVTG